MNPLNSNSRASTPAINHLRKNHPGPGDPRLESAPALQVARPKCGHVIDLGQTAVIAPAGSSQLARPIRTDRTIRSLCSALFAGSDGRGGASFPDSSLTTTSGPWTGAGKVPRPSAPDGLRRRRLERRRPWVHTRAPAWKNRDRSVHPAHQRCPSRMFSIRCNPRRRPSRLATSAISASSMRLYSASHMPNASKYSPSERPASPHSLSNA